MSTTHDLAHRIATTKLRYDFDINLDATDADAIDIEAQLVAVHPWLSMIDWGRKGEPVCIWATINPDEEARDPRKFLVFTAAITDLSAHLSRAGMHMHLVAPNGSVIEDDLIVYGDGTCTDARVATDLYLDVAWRATTMVVAQ